MEILFILGALIAGILIGIIIIRFFLKGKYNTILQNAEKDAAAIKDKKLLEVKEVFLNKKNELEKEVQQRNQKLLQSENKLKQRELNISQRQSALSRQKAELDK